jgi:hypothetical protein
MENVDVSKRRVGRLSSIHVDLEDFGPFSEAFDMQRCTVPQGVLTVCCPSR